MKNSTIDQLITDLISKCGLGAVMFPIEPVSGGLMHRMYCVSTDSGLYAVKHLNPEIMRREGVHDNYRRAEEIECLLEKEDIPIIPAITIHGKKMQHIEGNYFYLFHWQDGHITDWNHISNEMCHTAGNILGKMHAVKQHVFDLGNHSCKKPESNNINWPEYVRKANDKKNEIAPVLNASVQLLIYAETELNRARALLPDILCISDEDMDPKNILWDQGRPWVIDLECLDYGNPVSHALQLALQWAGIATCSIDVKKMTHFLKDICPCMIIAFGRIVMYLDWPIPG